MAIKFFGVGCNYPGTDYSLPDCELDAELMSETFGPYCASRDVLLSKQATYKKAAAALQDFLSSCKSGDVALMWFSGHGTIFRTGGKWRTAIVLNDGQALYEESLRLIINGRPRGVIAVMGLDSCHSAGMVRFNGRKLIVRTIPSQMLPTPKDVPPKAVQKQPNAEYLGCREHEYSYSTGNGGAMTLATVRAFSERKPRTTLRSLYTGIRKELPSEEWPQTPHFVCADTGLAKRTVNSFAKEV